MSFTRVALILAVIWPDFGYAQSQDGSVFYEVTKVSEMLRVSFPAIKCGFRDDKWGAQLENAIMRLQAQIIIQKRAKLAPTTVDQAVDVARGIRIAIIMDGIRDYEKMGEAYCRSPSLQISIGAADAIVSGR